jgi:hypothetical protein
MVINQIASQKNMADYQTLQQLDKAQRWLEH